MKNVGLEQSRASNRLASGYRINTAADDAAGLAISESMRAQIRGLDQASRNAQDGQSLIRTAEGGMQEIQNMVQRIRELTVQASNDTNNEDNRGSHISLEIEQLLTEIEEMATRVEFNGMTLLNGQLGGGGLDPQHEQITKAMDIARSVLATYGMTGLDTKANPIGVGGLAAFNTAFFNTLWMEIGDLGDRNDLVVAGDARRDAVAALIGVSAQALEDLETDTALTVDNAAGHLATLSALAAATRGELSFQIGANANQLMSTSIADMRVTNGGADSLGGALGDFMDTWVADFSSNSAEKISKQLDNLDAAIEFVNVARAELGAVSNRLDYTMRSLDLSSENLQDAESRIRNTDMAREMMRFTMANVLQQASVSMLSQANQMPNNLLQLLR